MGFKICIFGVEVIVSEQENNSIKTYLKPIKQKKDSDPFPQPNGFFNSKKSIMNHTKTPPKNGRRKELLHGVL